MTNTASTKPAALLSFSIKDMVLCGMFAALLGVISQLSIPMPTGVPLTVQLFFVALTGAVLGSRLGFASALIFILVGAAGVPVFANLRGGISALISVTGGYLWSYPLMAALCGISPKNMSKEKRLIIQLCFATLGFILTETLGALQWAALAGDKTLGYIAVYSMTAFVPKDFVLTILAILIGIRIRGILVRGGIL